MTTIFKSKILLGIQKIKKWKGSKIAKKLVSQKLENTDEREKNHESRINERKLAHFSSLNQSQCELHQGIKAKPSSKGTYIIYISR